MRINALHNPNTEHQEKVVIIAIDNGRVYYVDKYGKISHGTMDSFKVTDAEYLEDTKVGFKI